MAMEVCIRDERCLTLGAVGDTSGFLSRVDCTSLPRFIDRYGDTVFNRLQIDDFLREWSELGRTAKTADEISFVRDVTRLAQACKRSRTSTCAFVGD